MGSKIAYLVEEKLEQKGIVSGLLIVSGGRIPSVPELNPISKLPDKEFVDGLLRFNGMPSEIIKNKQLFEFFLPIIRADFILDESYYPQKVNKLQCPILAFGGKNDMEANLEEIKKWAECTFSHFAYKIFEGEHFFVKEQETLVLEEIRKNVL